MKKMIYVLMMMFAMTAFVSCSDDDDDKDDKGKDLEFVLGNKKKK